MMENNLLKRETNSFISMQNWFNLKDYKHRKKGLRFSKSNLFSLENMWYLNLFFRLIYSAQVLSQVQAKVKNTWLGNLSIFFLSDMSAYLSKGKDSGSLKVRTFLLQDKNLLYLGIKDGTELYSSVTIKINPKTNPETSK